MGGTRTVGHAPAAKRGPVHRARRLGIRQRWQRADYRHRSHHPGASCRSGMIRGAVYPVELGDAKRGPEQRGRRLGLVISIEQDDWSTVTILPTSASAQAAIFRPEVVIAGRKTRILTDQIRTIDTSYVTGELVDYLSRYDLAQVEYSLSRYLGLLRCRAAGGSGATALGRGPHRWQRPGTSGQWRGPPGPRRTSRRPGPARSHPAVRTAAKGIGMVLARCRTLIRSPPGR